MKYYILLKIPAPCTKFYIEVGLEYELPFHPNITDELEIADIRCKINEIRYNLDSMDYVKMRIEAIDYFFASQSQGKTPEQIHKCLQQEWQDLKKWANGKKIILNDYYMHPERPYRETED